MNATNSPVPGKEPLAILIDADNVSPAFAGAVFRKAGELGEPILRRAYGMVGCFSATGGWTQIQREYGIVAKPQVSNVSGKNVADIALVIDAMEILYKGACRGICIVSSDSDFTALATKIREGGKHAYGIGGEKTPGSFRAACTRFFEMSLRDGSRPKPKSAAEPVCPRCGGRLEPAWTKSRQAFRLCKACGGMTLKLAGLRKVFTDENLSELAARARAHEQPGCTCPDCGSSMSLLLVSKGKRRVEIDVCGKCRSVWFDKDEFESLSPQDGVLSATVSAGKAFRREMVLALAADLRNGRCKAATFDALKKLIKNAYHVPGPDLAPIVSTLQCQRVIAVDKKGALTVLPPPA